MNVILAVVLLVCTILLYFAFSILLSKQKYAILKEPERKFVPKTVRKEGSLANSKLVRFFSIGDVLEEGKRFDWNIGLNRYLTILFPGILSAMIVLFLIFGVHVFLLFAIPIGFAVPRALLFMQKAKYLLTMEKQIDQFIKTVSSDLMTYQTVYQALDATTNYLQEPVKTEVKQAVQRMEQGDTVQIAFKPMVDRFKVPELQNTVNLIHALQINGTSIDKELATTQRSLELRVTEREKANKTWQTPYFFTLLFALLPIAVIYAMFNAMPGVQEVVQRYFLMQVLLLGVLGFTAFVVFLAIRTRYSDHFTLQSTT